MTHSYMYTFVSREEERALCQLEMRAFFGKHTTDGVLTSAVAVHPERSPFMKERIEVLQTAVSLNALQQKIALMPAESASFKVVFVKNPALPAPDFPARKRFVQKIGAAVNGTADLHHPEEVYALFPLEEGWVFGRLMEHRPVWLAHEKKPYQYSTALSTRLARTVANIAVPDPENIRAIDPCCGIGTVLIEAASMGIHISGSDNNPKVMKGLRANLQHFHLDISVALQDMLTIEETYDTAVIDMPYNLCSVLTAPEKLSMIQAARQFTSKLVLVSIEPMQEIIEQSGFTIQDRCTVSKNKMFSREVYVCS